MTSDKKPKRGRGRPAKPLPEPIDADPMTIARVVLNAPPKKADEWEYLKKSDKSQNRGIVAR